uniref:Uncharacterized protein n=1 Tax=Arundo donax TaxID=35708 RepID=A0A0A9G8G6_ARUDO
MRTSSGRFTPPSSAWRAATGRPCRSTAS